jgi:hypothetical protein
MFVEHRIAESYPIFKFHAVERDPIPDVWERLQFVPGQRPQRPPPTMR